MLIVGWTLINRNASIVGINFGASLGFAWVTREAAVSYPPYIFATAKAFLGVFAKRYFELGAAQFPRSQRRNAACSVAQVARVLKICRELMPINARTSRVCLIFQLRKRERVRLFAGRIASRIAGYPYRNLLLAVIHRSATISNFITDYAL